MPPTDAYNSEKVTLLRQLEKGDKRPGDMNPREQKLFDEMIEEGFLIFRDDKTVSITKAALQFAAAHIQKSMGIKTYDDGKTGTAQTQVTGSRLEDD